MQRRPEAGSGGWGAQRRPVRKSEGIDGNGPRRLSNPLARVLRDQAPQTLLAEVQTAWPDACGEAIAAASEPVAEREGKVTIACESGAWAQELELMGELLRGRLEAIVGENRLVSLRFTADLSRHR